MKVLYITSSIYPGENAYATRIDGICQALKKGQHDVTVMTDYSTVFFGKAIYNGIDVVTGSKHIHKDRTLWDKVLAFPRMIFLLKKLLLSNQYDCAIVGSMYTRIALVSKALRKEGIPIVLECCEWFDTYNWKNGKNSIEYKAFNHAWNTYFLRVDGVIAISRMISNYYSNHGIKTLVLPTILDTNKIKWSSNTDNGFIRLVFVGSIDWGKDRLSDVIRSMDQMKTQTISLDVVGPTKAQVEKQLNQDAVILSRLRDRIIFHGRIPHDQVAEICRQCDYGLIIRPDRRQSHAGFPTKLAEYMSTGTPVIANETGDVGLYLQDEVNGFLLSRKYTQDDLDKLLEKIVYLDMDVKREQRINARKTAEKYFDLASAYQPLNEFIFSIVERKKNQ